MRHQDLVVGVQLAWRDLLGLGYVPSKFKKRYLGPLLRWCERLPLHRGIPLGSSLSAVAAPLMLVPLWLEVRRRFGVPLTVYMDDVVVCCRDERQCSEVYALIENRLHEDYGLSVHPGKTVSGRFATGSFSFCGWSFAGGCARIDREKEDEFAGRLLRAARVRRGRDSIRALVKRVNRLTDGFGHYYKHGDVKRQYERLDIQVRRAVRASLSCYMSGRIYNGDLERLGLRSLCGILERHLRRDAPVGSRTAGTGALQPGNTGDRRLRPLRRPTPGLSSQAAAAAAGATAERAACQEAIVALLRRLDAKMSQLVRGQRRLGDALERIAGMW